MMRSPFLLAAAASLLASSFAVAAPMAPAPADRAASPLIHSINQTGAKPAKAKPAKAKPTKPAKPVKADCKKAEDGSCLKKPHGDKHKAKVNGKTTKYGNPVKPKPKAG